MKRPPKNMISVTRNTHMPRVDASICCPMLSKWCCRYGWCGVWPCGCSDNADLMARGVLVRPAPHDRRGRENLGRRGRGNFPPQPARAPGVGPGERRGLERPNEVDHGNTKHVAQERLLS